MNKTEEKALNRERIIQAAIVEFGLHEYESASTNQICADASISKGLLYHYFKSKENLFAETLRHCMEDFCREAACGEGIMGIDCLAAVYGHHVAFFAAHPYHYRLISRFAAGGTLPGNDETLGQCRKKIRSFGLGALEKFLESIPLRPETDKERILEVLTILVGTIQRKYISAAQQNELTVQDAQRQFGIELTDALSLICRGIAA